MPQEGFKYVDLFAGIGGFHAALSAMGGECVYAVEIDGPAARTYKMAWDHDPLGDVTLHANDSVMSVPKHDVLVAGFPCQPFSKSGAQRGMEETRGTLYWNILKIIKAHHPSVVLLENVRNLAGPRHLHEWDVIIETLRAEHYYVSSTPAVFSPHQIPRHLGGRPQVRERVFITATYDPNHRGAPNPQPVVTPKTRREEFEPSSWDLARDLPLDPERHISGCDLTAAERWWIDAWDAWVRMYYELSAGAQPPGFPIWVDDWRTTDALEALLLDQPDLPAWKVNFLRKNAALYEDIRFREAFDDWIEEWGVRTEAFPPSRRKFEWQAQDTPSLWECVMHFRPSGIRAKKPTYLPALVAITQTSIIGPRRRRLSPREAARLQGLPDGFPLDHQPDAVSYKQLGNGVNVGAVWFVLREHVARDEEILRRTARGREILRAVQSAPDNPDEILNDRFSDRGDAVGHRINGDEILRALGTANERAKHDGETLAADPALAEWRSVIARFQSPTTPKTYLAVIAIAMTARAMHDSGELDVRHTKTSASSLGYSASSIGKSLASFAKEQGIDLRATSTQPMNNQPFTYRAIIERDVNVQAKFQQAWYDFYDALTRINDLDPATSAEALALLFHLCRRVEAPTLRPQLKHAGKAAHEQVVEGITEFVEEHSDNGAVGQAYVAALFDVAYSPVEVMLGKIQDPDAATPGDVQVGSTDVIWLWAEAKQKPVVTGDIEGFLRKVHSAHGERVLYCALANQPYSGHIKHAQLDRLAEKLGIGLRIVESPLEAATEILSHAPGSFASMSERLITRMHARLIESGCAPATTEAFTRVVSRFADVDE